MKKLLALTLIMPDARYVKYMDEIKSSLLFTDMGRMIDEDGLYSQRIFGTVGSKERNRIFGYIDYNCEIIHPRIYEYIITLSSLYKRILSGEAYAKFDVSVKDFVETDILNGETGYAFFFKYIDKIKFKETDSDQRKNKIKAIYNYLEKGKVSNSKLLVLPAGLREFSIDKNGRTTEPEINEYYRNIFNLGSLINNFSKSDNIDNLRYNLQIKQQELYKYIWGLLDGKKKLIQGEWGSRATEMKTRTVAANLPDEIEDLDKTQDFVDLARVGLVVYIKSIDPLAKHLLRKNFIDNIIREDTDTSRLMSPEKTITTVIVPDKVKDIWLTNDGLDNIMNMLLDNDIKNEAIMIGDHWLSPIIDKGREIIYYENIDDIPEEDYEYARAITYGELFYLSIYEVNKTLPSFIVRYPITETGSLVPCISEAVSTSENRKVNFLRKGIIESSIEIDQYPILESSWINGIKVSYTRVDGLGLDFDGDQIGFVTVLSEEAQKEVFNLLNSTEAYISPDNNSMLSATDKVVENIIRFMTK